MSEDLSDHLCGNLGHSVDEAALKRLADAVRELRGDRSQREFGEIIGVAQSTVAGWEGGKNTPNLENIEKLANIRGQTPEDFVAYLYGRGFNQSYSTERLMMMLSRAEKANLLRAIADEFSQ
jgi:transcriptional regulator with XRE-family HTH domain